jgi:hypothetical protein
MNGPNRLRSQVRFASELLSHAAEDYDSLPDDFEKEVPHLAETGVLSPDLWIRTMDLASHVRTSLEWIAWGIRLEYGGSIPNPRLATFPMPGRPGEFRAAIGRLRASFPGVEVANPELFAYLAGLVENEREEFEWIVPLHSLWNHLKHRSPIDPAIRLLNSRSQRTELRIQVDAADSGVIDLLETLSRAGRETRQVLVKVGELGGLKLGIEIAGLKEDFF